MLLIFNSIDFIAFLKISEILILPAVLIYYLKTIIKIIPILK